MNNPPKKHTTYLGDARRGHVGLVVENPAKVVAVRKDLVLSGQESAAGVDQVEAGEAVLEGDLLRWVVGVVVVFGGGFGGG